MLAIVIGVGSAGAWFASGPLMTEALCHILSKDLDNQILYGMFKLQVEVFVVGQVCPYPELDGRDLLVEARHF